MKSKLCLAVLLVLCAIAGADTTTFKSVENMAFSTLNGGINDSVLSFTVASGEGALFPSSGAFYVVLFQDITSAYEVVLVDSRSTDTFTVNASGRGAQDSTAQSWADGTYVQMTWTAGQIEAVHTAINAIEAGTNTLAQVDLNDDADILFGTGDDMQMRFDGTVLEIVDAAANTMLDLTDNGAAGTLRVLDTLSTGASDTTAGTLNALGGTTTTGGTVNVYNAADSDTTVDLWSLTSNSGDLEFRYDSTAFMTVDDATGTVTFEGNIEQGSSSKNKMRSFWVPVSDMTGTAESTTVTIGDFTVLSRDFDDSTDETCYFTVGLPDYTGGDLDIHVIWAATAATTKVDWVVYCYSAYDQETPALTTAHSAMDIAPGNNMVGIIGVTVTPDDAEAGDRPLFFAVSRDADDGTNDTYVGDSSLIGVLIWYN